ncbi:MAG TPA: sugar ABC transporter permease [Trueperaceae bacterium]
MTLSHPKRPALLRLDDRNPLVPYLYLLPHAVLFLIFIVFPIGFGIFVSLHRWNLLSDQQVFVGLDHYRSLFTPGSPEARFFWKTLLNTILFVVITVPLLIACAIGLALLLHKPIWGRGFFRTVFFLPTILAVSIMGLLWKWMFENGSGLINVILDQLPLLDTVPFLTTVGWAWVPIIVGTLWWTVGFNMVLYSAALAAVPQAYYDAAQLDGAGRWAQFRHVTWPMLTPVTIFTAVTSTIASFQLFGQSHVITAGGPLRSTQSVMMYITEEAFTNFQFSSAAAMSMVFGLALLLISVFQFRLLLRDTGRGAD